MNLHHRATRTATYCRVFLLLAHALCAVCLIAFAGAAFAQVESADILGKVADNTKAIIPGAVITVKNLDTGVARTVKSNGAGEFTFATLPIGRYSITISSAGFETYTVPDLTLSQGDRTRVDATLVIGTSETVNVASVDPEIQTDSSVLGTVVTDREVEDLPLNGRNFMELAQLTVGANEGPPNALNSGQRPDDRRLTSSVSVNGQPESTNNQLIDGLDNNERIIGTIGVRPSVDAIAEFRVATNLYTAEVGRAAGAQINIITKTGTNTMHGTVYEFFRNDVFDATNPFALTHIELRQNQYGASLGGPIKKDKLFYFIDYEGFRQVQGQTYTSTVPTLAEEQTPGYFGDIGHSNICSAPGQTGCNGLIDPVGLAYFKLYPAPNKPGTANNYVYSPNNYLVTQTGDSRVDYALPRGDRFFARYTINQVDAQVPGELAVAANGIAPGGNPFGFAGSSDQRSENVQLNYVHLFSPNVLGELKGGYTYIKNASFPLNYGQDYSDLLGVKGANLGTAITSALTTMSPVGYASVGDGIYLPLRNTDNTYQTVAQLTWNRGKQSLKFGGALVRRHVTSEQSTYPAGYLTFNTHITQGGPGGATSCAPLGCLLAGIVDIAQRSNQLVVPAFRTWESSGYVQDDWRILPKLTLNLGIRYDVFTPLTEAHDHIANFDPGSGTLLVAGVNGVSSSAGVKTDYSNLAPRVGFAAALEPTTVIRGGFGLTYIPITPGAKTALGNVPYTYNYRSIAYTTLISTGIPIPTVQAPNNLNATEPAGFTLAGIATNYRSAYIEQYNLTLQQQIGKSVFTLSWVGEIGKHLYLNPNVNLAPPSTACPAGVTGPNPACYQSRLPFYNEFPTATTINETVSEGYSNYNALQAVLSHRFTKDLGLNANYTWAHGLNDNPNYGTSQSSNGTIPSQISKLDYGDSDLNIRNRFAMLLDYSLPFGRGRHNFTSKLIQGFQTNATLVISGGLPFSVVDGTAYSNTGVSGGGERAVQIGNPNVLPNHRGIYSWFACGQSPGTPASMLTPNQIAPASTNAACAGPSQTIAYASQTFGTYLPSRRNSIYGPNYRVFNFSLFRTFPIKERYRLQFRVESFNLTNTPNYNQPDSEIGDAAFGTISSTRTGYQPRTLQFALKLLF